MLIGLNNVTFEFGARVIVEDATWHIHPGERIGLIGYNGTGKSTLLKIFTGQYQPSAGPGMPPSVDNSPASTSEPADSAPRSAATMPAGPAFSEMT